MPVTEVPQDHLCDVLSGFPLPPDVRSAIYATKLSAGLTRVARLSKGSFHDPIECSIEVVSIGGDIRYEALSWYWGKINPATDPFITAGGFQFQIPANLEPALRHFRLADKDRVLWCDAIVLNQVDASEKAMQVACMGEIYREAAGVLVWLGEANDDSRLAIDTINRFVDELYGKDAGVRSIEEFEQSHPVLDADSSEFRAWLREKQFFPSSSPFDPQPWAACSRLLRRPWFHRLWVIQEVCLNREPIAMFAGSDFTYLVWMRLLTVAAPHMFDDEQRSSLVKAGYQTMDCPILFHCESYLSKNSPSLLQLLWESRRQKCTVSHDRIYAILSMRQHPEVNVDYTIPAWKVFRDVTVQSIATDHSLQALTACMPSENKVPDCPSWVPDWSIDSENRPLMEIAHWFSEGSQAFIKQILPYNTPRFRASGNRQVEVTGLSERKLTVRGVRVSMVTEKVFSWSETVSALDRNLRRSGIQTTFPSSEPSDPLWEAVAVAYVRICRQAATNANSDVNPAVLARTLCAGFSQLYAASPEKREEIERFALRLCDGKTDDTVDVKNFELASSFYALVLIACDRRRFCMGLRGRPILAPEDTQPGDHVVILFGSPVPLILRPKHPEQPERLQYTLIGECYVDGIMHGTFLEHIEPTILDQRTFNLEIE